MNRAAALTLTALVLSSCAGREASPYQQAYDKCFTFYEGQYGKESEMTDLHLTQSKRLCDLEGQRAELQAQLLNAK